MSSLVVHHFFYDSFGRPVAEGFLFPDNVYFLAPVGDPPFCVDSIPSFLRYVKRSGWVLGKPFPSSYSVNSSSSDVK